MVGATIQFCELFAKKVNNFRTAHDKKACGPFYLQSVRTYDEHKTNEKNKKQNKLLYKYDAYLVQS